MDSRQELFDSLSVDELRKVWLELGEEYRRRQPSPPGPTPGPIRNLASKLGRDKLRKWIPALLDELPGVDLPALVQRVRAKA